MLSHHAYYVEGSSDLLLPLITSIREHQKFSEHDPGLVSQVFEKFTIDDARELIQKGSLKNTTSETIYCFSIGSIGSDAQQALLKLFEEPQDNTVYIIVVPHGTLISTLRSRMLPYPEILTASENETAASLFVEWDYKKRSEWVTKLLKDTDDARGYVQQFFIELEQALHPKIQTAEVRRVIEDIERFRPYLLDTAPSLKMILEHFAITIPILK